MALQSDEAKMELLVMHTIATCGWKKRPNIEKNCVTENLIYVTYSFVLGIVTNLVLFGDGYH